MPGLLYADDLVLCAESEDDLRVMVGRFAEVYIRRGLKVSEIRLEHVSEFKYLRFVLEESGTDGTECSRKMASGRRVAGTIRSLINAGICSFSVLESCMRYCLFQ